VYYARFEHDTKQKQGQHFPNVAVSNQADKEAQTNLYHMKIDQSHLPHLISSLFWEVKQHRMVVIVISGQAITFFHVLLVPFLFIVYKVVCFVCFFLIL
jgi:hypothetical protein